MDDRYRFPTSNKHFVERSSKIFKDLRCNSGLHLWLVSWTKLPKVHRLLNIIWTWTTLLMICWQGVMRGRDIARDKTSLSRLATIWISSRCQNVITALLLVSIFMLLHAPENYIFQFSQDLIKWSFCLSQLNFHSNTSTTFEHLCKLRSSRQNVNLTRVSSVIYCSQDQVAEAR